MENPIARFEKFIMPEPNTGCWIWNGALGNFGYGMFYFKPPRKAVYAHRVSFILYRGEIPAGLCVCHTCDNSFCVNPQHLFLGTHLDNAKDRTKKGRGRVPWTSSNSPLTKLTDVDVFKIRKLHVLGFNNAQIAKIIGTCRANVSHIVNRKTWKAI